LLGQCANFVLIPNTRGATMVTQFRPISLLNVSSKTIVKVLANRLGMVLGERIDKARAL